jgi:hypothetical protein
MASTCTKQPHKSTSFIGRCHQNVKESSVILYLRLPTLGTPTIDGTYRIKIISICR